VMRKIGKDHSGDPCHGARVWKLAPGDAPNSGDSIQQREMIATVVSATNKCSYWMTAHGEALRTESKDNQLVEGVKQDYTQLDLPPAERAMLDYAVKLTVAPSSASEADISELRNRAFDDRDILNIIYVICLYNFNDRLADATGISGHDFLYG
jgi:uncharacterized peroxidase-related enzyme